MVRVVGVADNWKAMGGALLDRIEELIDAPAAPDEVERTLTDGYAEALSLEAERWRIHRRIGEAAAQLEDGDAERVRELSRLARRLAKTDGELARLRDRLAELRSRARDMQSLKPARQPST
jgi:hypothetical protein